MNKKVNIILDASGSMAEENKNVVVKYLLNGILNNIEFSNIEFELFQWCKNSKKIENLKNFKIEFIGKSDILGLAILEKYINKENSILFISDGNIDLKEKQKIKSMSNNIVCIFIGVDSNKSTLKDIATNNGVYSVVDFLQTLNEL